MLVVGTIREVSVAARSALRFSYDADIIEEVHCHATGSKNSDSVEVESDGDTVRLMRTWLFLYLQWLKNCPSV